jgi:DNA-binding CsgD family transcriptional regulator
MTVSSIAYPHRIDELVDRAASARTIEEVFDVAVARLRRLVPFDAAAWHATDPATHLPTAGTLDGDERIRAWELEFLVEDVNLYDDLARAPVPAGGLRAATGDRPARSPRYRELLRPRGVDDELRAVLRADGRPWAALALYRRNGRHAFASSEIELVAGLSQPLGQAVRAHAARPAPPGSSPPRLGRGPGVMILAADGELIRATDDAFGWLAELTSRGDGADRPPVGLPTIVAATLVRARAVAEGRDDRPALARVRSGGGRWLSCRASCLRERDGALGDTAIVVEPATSAEIAPLVLEALGFSLRERQITDLITAGAGTSAIAAHLHLSSHTVRDYIKAIFEKVGVSSRGELVARLLAEHDRPVRLGGGREADENTPHARSWPSALASAA